MAECDHDSDQRWCGVCVLSMKTMHPHQVGPETIDGYETGLGAWQAALFDPGFDKP